MKWKKTICKKILTVLTLFANKDNRIHLSHPDNQLFDCKSYYDVGIHHFLDIEIHAHLKRIFIIGIWIFLCVKRGTLAILAPKNSSKRFGKDENKTPDYLHLKIWVYFQAHKSLYSPKKWKNVVLVSEKKVSAPIPKLDFGFGSLYRNLILVIHFVHSAYS